MAYVVPRGPGRWELRESVGTPKGPRARTLASFRTLTPELMARARTRAERPVTEAELRQAAMRAGAPVETEPAESAGARLLAEIGLGRPLSAATRRLLVDALGRADRSPSDAERAAAPWIGASLQRRAEVLEDLLLLGDRLPAERNGRLRFPRIESERP